MTSPKASPTSRSEEHTSELQSRLHPFPTRRSSDLIDGGGKASPELHASVMRMLDEVRGFPQVRAAAVSNTPPYAFSTSEGTRRINGKDVTMIIDDVTEGFADVKIGRAHV